jgi:hypothetical protein
MRCLRLFLIFNFSFLIATCGLDVEDPTPPSPPVWVQKSLPEEWPEAGIDANETGGIFFEWHANIDDNIQTYLIFRSIEYLVADSSSEFELLAEIKASLAIQFNYVDRDVSTSNRYHYRLKAKNDAGATSEFSDVASYTLLWRIQLEMMSPTRMDETLPSDRKLAWHNYYTNYVEEYCLTLLRDDGELIFRIMLQPEDYFSGDEFYIIPEDYALEMGRLYSWRVEVNADYIEGFENAGSESPWANFRYIAE